MIHQPIKPLQVVSASAGSGKTYNLVYQYILLLFKTPQKDTFTKIVAMTFTNKAALEMKTRVIGALEALAFPDSFPVSARKYESPLQAELKISKQEIYTKAKVILKSILHRYEDFMLLTIDKFNLKLLRSFSRDLDIAGDFEVIIDANLLLQKVLDQLLSEIGTENHTALTKLALSFAENQISEDNSWNIQTSIKNVMQGLIKEKNVDLVQLLREKDYGFLRYAQLKNEIEKLKKPVLENAKELDNYLNTNTDEGWGMLLKGKSKTIAPLRKAANDPFLKKDILSSTVITNINEGSKSTPPIPELCSLVHRLEESQAKVYNRIKKLSLLKSQHHLFAFLQLISKRLEETRNEDKILLISEFNEMLSKLVQGVEAPFIYDRLGYRYRHFLLDEFQDTSRMQWLNIVPLIHEFIASNHLCFIVGDPKQSIYRFKNGLAEQFVALPAIYNPENDPNLSLKSQYFSQMGEKKPIVQNWRSSSNIVDFNNRFFEELKGSLPSASASFYDNHWQDAVAKKEGFVSIDLKKDPDFKTEMGESWILEKVNECIEDGFSPGDITILGNKNSECLHWAKALTQNGFSVVSADSLLVDSDQMVQLLVAYFHLRLRSNSDIYQKKFIAQFIDVQGLTLPIYQKYVVREEKYKRVKFEDFVTDYFSDKSEFFFSFENLYDLGKKAAELLNIEPLQNHYVHHFLDLLFEFDKVNGPDLLQFLAHYKEKGYKSAVQIPESDQTIQVMTVHKSKGLEFEVVLIPNIKIRKSSNKNSDWFKIEDDVIEFNVSTSDPIDEAVEMLEQEKSQILMDGVNILYVGFTRPVERLYGHIHLDSDTKLIQQTIESAFAVELIENDKLQLGSRQPKERKENETKAVELFTPQSLNKFIWFPKIALKESNHLVQDQPISDAISFGNQFHLLLSVIKAKDEIDERINSLIAEGTIDARFKDDFSRQSKSIFTEILEPIYRNSTKIISERSLLIPNIESTFRPDKIIFHENRATILDFKTGEPKKKDEKQISEYASIVRQMGYEVRAGIVYTEKSNVQWIEQANTLF